VFCFHHWVGAVIAAEIWSFREFLIIIRTFVRHRFQGNSPLYTLLLYQLAPQLYDHSLTYEKEY
jgi:hypothetical protein